MNKYDFQKSKRKMKRWFKDVVFVLGAFFFLYSIGQIDINDRFQNISSNSGLNDIIDDFSNEIDKAISVYSIITDNTTTDTQQNYAISLEDVPEWDGSTTYYIINSNIPFFNEVDTDSFELYSDLDELGRCGVAFANVSTEIMPTESREEISSVYPSGWNQIKYDSSLVDGGYLYNRCHLIGFQLAGENANPKNLITGTRYFNVNGMLPFEDEVASYCRTTGNHVYYRVTPIYQDNELVARGVLMEAQSVETDDVQFCVYVYNAQPGITINYSDGSSFLNNN